MGRKPKQWSVFVVEWKASYRLKQSHRAWNPERREGLPIVKVCLSTEPPDAAIKAELGKARTLGLVEGPDCAAKSRTQRWGALSYRDKIVATLRSRGWTVVNEPPAKTYSVYCLELDKAAKPSAEKSIFYVGQTGQSVEARVQNHLEGKNANKKVRDHFVRTRPDLVADAKMSGLMTELDSLRAENRLAKILRERGHVVFGGK